MRGVARNWLQNTAAVGALSAASAANHWSYPNASALCPIRRGEKRAADLAGRTRQAARGPDGAAVEPIRGQPDERSVQHLVKPAMQNNTIATPSDPPLGATTQRLMANAITN